MSDALWEVKLRKIVWWEGDQDASHVPKSYTALVIAADQEEAIEQAMSDATDNIGFLITECEVASARRAATA